MDNTALKNLRDFLLQYNKISESCFMHCVNHLSDRDLSQDECGCVDMCTKKHVSVNHKVMQVYMEVQPEIINKRIEDVNKQQMAAEEAKRKKLENIQMSRESNVRDLKIENLDESKKIVENNVDSKVLEKGNTKNEKV